CAELFADDPRVSVPELVWERATRRVLTLQDVTAIKINDVDALRAAGIDPAEVAAEFANVMFDQLFVHGFFHADPHPGNIFVTPLPRPVAAVGGGEAAAGGRGAGGGIGRAWTLTFIDFGMMGEVPPNLRHDLQQLVIAVAARNTTKMIE